jgi:hypothetical protein
MWHVWGTREVHTGFDLMERDHLEDLGIDGRIILKKLIFKKWNGEARNELLCLRIGTSGGRL